MWIPQDYVIDGVTVRKTDGMTKYLATFVSDRGELSIRILNSHMADSTTVEERDDGAICFPHRGINYYILSNYEQVKVEWSVGERTCIISGQITEEEAEEIVESIK